MAVVPSTRVVNVPMEPEGEALRGASSPNHIQRSCSLAAPVVIDVPVTVALIPAELFEVNEESNGVALLTPE